MNELEDEIVRLKSEVENNEKRIATLKSGLWQKKKSLKALEEALGIIKGTENDKEEDETPPGLKSVI